MWGIRKGFARLRIPKFPAIQATGDRRHFLEIEPRALREWAMMPMALQLGINVAHMPGAGGIPARKSTQAAAGMVTVAGKPAQLKADEVYVGQGLFSHRLRKTKWASPFHVGRDGTAQECVRKYTDWLHRRGPISHIEELVGKTLVCDCV